MWQYKFPIFLRVAATFSSGMATVAGYGPNESGQGFGWIGCATILWRSPILVILLLDELHNSSDGCTDTQDTTFPHNTTLTII